MIFREEWFRYFDTPPRDLICFTTVDPANDPEDSKSAPDWNVVLTTGKDVNTGIIYILEYTRERCSPGKLISNIFNHVKKYSPVKVGVETVQYQKTLKYWIRDRMRKEGLFFLVEELTHTKRSKGARILGLQPIFSNFSIYMRLHMHDLKRELLAYPLGAFDDVIDTLASQIELWTVTKSVKEEKLKRALEDPLSVDSLISELQEKARNKSKTGRGLTSDIFNRRGALQFN